MKLGLYRHFKIGNFYVAYDLTVDEESGKTRVSYLSLPSRMKHSRFLESFLEPVGDRDDNLTGQYLRFTLIDEKVKFVATHKFDEEPTINDFLAANSIPFRIEVGDLVEVPLPVGKDDTYATKEWEVSGVIDKGVYVHVGNDHHAVVMWKNVKSVSKNFKKLEGITNV